MKIKISYEGMPFDHMNNLKVLKNLYPNCEIKTQPNTFYIDGEFDINEIKKCSFLFNEKIEPYNEIHGLTYDECKNKILSLLTEHNVVNINTILHKNSCLYINPKACTFNLDIMNLPVDIVISVLNDQLIFFTSDKKCIFLCEYECNPSIESIKLILHGRLYDRSIAIERDLKYFDSTDYINSTIMDLCHKMNADEFLCKNAYYDRNSRTVNEDLSLLGIISSIKFSDDRLRQIHKDGVFSEDVMIVKCIMHLCNLLTYDLPSGNLDPFGVKKSADFIVNYVMHNSLNIPVLPSEICEFLKKRLINKLKNSDLTLCKEIDWKSIHKDKNIKIDISSIKRIAKLAHKSSPTEHVDLTVNEKELKEKIDFINFSNINDYVSQFIEYIDNTRIGIYFERIEILKSLISKIESIIEIK